MADTNRSLIFPVLPGNCPDAGYKLVSKNGFIEAPLTGENLEWAKDEAITDADKQQIITNKNDITELKTDKQDKLTPGTNITIDENNVISATGGGGGFTPTQAQLDAMNSGIDSTKVGQIATNADDIDQLETDLADKVDKIAGKGLSTNDYTNADKTKLDGIDMTTKQDVLNTSQMNAVNSGIDSTKVAQITTNANNIANNTTAIGNKVDKVSGKGLSTNDYTTADQTKVGYIGNGVETLTFTLADSSTVTLKVVKGV